MYVLCRVSNVILLPSRNMLKYAVESSWLCPRNLNGN
jgi:hypothetical protein